MFIDSHCHLNYPGLAEQQDEVIARARQVGVHGMLSISTRMSEWDEVISVARGHEGIWASVGIHPHDADAHQHVGAERLLEAAKADKVVAIGETGLDYYYDKSDRERQRNCFRAHIHAARVSGLPLIVHMREAEADTAAILDAEMQAGSFTGVIHCFTASQEFASRALAMGLFISISGIVTFKNARELQAIAQTIPDDRLLIETDAPFLAPVPHRGHVCEPAFVADTARFLAALRGVSIETLAASTTANFHHLFNRAVPVQGRA